MMLGTGRIILVAHLALSTGVVAGISQMDVAAGPGMVETGVDDSAFTQVNVQKSGGNFGGKVMELTRGGRGLRKTSWNSSRFVDKEYNNFLIKYAKTALIFTFSMFFLVFPTALTFQILSSVVISYPYSSLRINVCSLDQYQKIWSYFVRPFLLSSSLTGLGAFLNYGVWIFLSLNSIYFSFVLLASSTIMFRVLAASVVVSQLFFLVLNTLISLESKYVQDYVNIPNSTDSSASHHMHKYLMTFFVQVYIVGFILLNLLPVIQLLRSEKWLERNLKIVFFFLDLFF